MLKVRSELAENRIDNQTGMLNLQAFAGECKRRLGLRSKSPQHDEMVDLFPKTQPPVRDRYAAVMLGITNLRRLISLSGFGNTDGFIKSLATAIRHTFPQPRECCCHYSMSTFCILAIYDENLEKRIESLRGGVSEFADASTIDLKAGIYVIPEDHSELSFHEIFERTMGTYDVALDSPRVAIRYYDDALGRIFSLHRHIRDHFEDALKNHWLEVNYQPVVSMTARRISSFEALARWNDPEFGKISPADFVPVLEQQHCIYKLDLFVVEEVCALCRKEFDRTGHWLSFSVNFSRLDFEECDLFEEVEALLQKYCIPTHCIRIELTESALTLNEGVVRTAVDNFKHAGHQVWMDDFGSGYSSFNVLKDYDFDVIKLDMRFFDNFLTNRKTSNIVSSIIGMSRAIGATVLAEGIELKEQWSFLKSEGCDLIQGFLISKPRPFDEFNIDYDAKN